MPSFEEEAFERARRLSHNRPGSNPPHSEAPQSAPPKPAPSKPAPPAPKPAPKPQPSPPPAIKQSPNLAETLFKNKDNSLIMLLLLLVMDEKTDPSLLFSLLYLLM